MLFILTTTERLSALNENQRYSLKQAEMQIYN